MHTARARLDREAALGLVHEYTKGENLRRHMLAVEAAMRAYARRFGEDETLWGLTGLLHDFDYERWPNEEHRPTEGHPSAGAAILRERGYPEEMIQAILGHATYTGVPRTTRLAKALYAVDELAGFLTACALVRPNGILDLEVASVKRKMKDPAFARGVDREELRAAAEELGVPFDEHVAVVLEALRGIAHELGLTGRGTG
jgi:putative nucleotidyltransferase with HDIG domain